MDQWNTSLSLDFPELFSSLDRSGFALLDEEEEGIRIYADKLQYDAGILYCHLLLTYKFSMQFYSSFQRLAKALVITMEDAHSGQCIAINLLDPHKTYPVLKGSNYCPDSAQTGQYTLTSYCEIPFSMELSRPGWGPHLFIRAQLQQFTSNILALDFDDDVKLGTYLDAQPYAVTLSDEDDE